MKWDQVGHVGHGISTALNNVKAETDEINFKKKYTALHFFVSSYYLFNDTKFANRYEQTLRTQIRLPLKEKSH